MRLSGDRPSAAASHRLPAGHSRDNLHHERRDGGLRDPTAFSDCGPLGVVLHDGPPPGGLFPLGPTIVEWRTVPDNLGVFTFCKFTVTVEHQPDLQIFCRTTSR
jgi:hypothetical protein